MGQATACLCPSIGKYAYFLVRLRDHFPEPTCFSFREERRGRQGLRSNREAEPKASLTPPSLLAAMGADRVKKDQISKYNQCVLCTGVCCDQSLIPPAHRPVSLRIYPARVVVAAEGRILCEHARIIRRSHDVPGQTVYDWRHYL